MAEDDVEKEMDMAALMEADGAGEAEPKPATPSAAPSAADALFVPEVHEAIYNIEVDVVAVLGRADLPIRQILKLGRGAVVELDRQIEEDIELFVNDILVAFGEIVTIGDVLGVKINKVVKSKFTRV